MSNTFHNKVALITGAGSGIGRATALAFAHEGANVVVSDIVAENGHETVSMIQEAGGEAHFIHADVSQIEHVASLVQETVSHYGSLDIGINNAGIGGSRARTADYPLEMWEKVLAVNLNGVFYCMRYQIPQMLAQGGGLIVNISSVAGLRGLPRSAPYSASKHAVVGLTKSAALEYARKNIRINAVCPVYTRTPLFEKLFEIDPTYEQKLERAIPMRRYGTPEDIAQAILWLCSDNASFITGQALPLDGGITAM